MDLQMLDAYDPSPPQVVELAAVDKESLRTAPEKKDDDKQGKKRNFQERRAAQKAKYQKVYAGAAQGTKGLRWVPKRAVNEFKEHVGTAHEAEDVDGGPNLTTAQALRSSPRHPVGEPRRSRER